MFAALYFLHWQMAIHGRQFASRRDRDDTRADMAAWLAAMETKGGEALRAQLLDWLRRYQFRGVTANVPAALVQWLQGAWPLVLREDIPGPREVLRMQARGTRAVTALTALPRMRESVLNKPDAFAFFLHDLEHAYKFFHSPALHVGQRIFFTALEDAIDRGVFVSYFGDAGFVDRFHYLMSDMNTHPELGLFRGILQALQRKHVLLQVDAAILLEFIDQVFDHAHVEILATEESVAVGGQDLELMFALDRCDLDDGARAGRRALRGARRPRSRPPRR